MWPNAVCVTGAVGALNEEGGEGHKVRAGSPEPYGPCSSLIRELWVFSEALPPTLGEDGQSVMPAGKREGAQLLQWEGHGAEETLRKGSSLIRMDMVGYPERVCDFRQAGLFPAQPSIPLSCLLSPQELPEHQQPFCWPCILHSKGGGPRLLPTSVVRLLQQLAPPGPL